MIAQTKKCVAEVLLVGVASLVASATGVAQEEEFQGKIGKTLADSEEHWPELRKPPMGAPNVLIWLIDDMGYGHSSAFGGLTPMPTIERLAENGLRFSNFHTTALCSPSRAAIAAGRNHHNIGMGSHSLTAMGFPGYADGWTAVTLHRQTSMLARTRVHPSSKTSTPSRSEATRSRS